MGELTGRNHATDLQSKLDELQLLKRQEQERTERAFVKERIDSEIEEEKRKAITKSEIRKKVEVPENTGERQKVPTIAKLPKLEITKFTGTHLDWLRF